MRLLMFFLFLISTVTTEDISRQCPRACRCRESRHITITYCNERGLKYVPVGISLNTKVLHLQGNSILNSAPSEENLRRLQSLKRLDLHKNKLAFFPKSLPINLEYLSLQKNRIKFIGRDAFSGLPRLKELHLDFNNISNSGISKNCFLKAKALQDLSMTGNSLTSPPKNLSPSIKSLRLDHNMIESVSKSSLESLSGLFSLDLSYNRIRIMDSLYHLGNLHTLNLASNLLEHIPRQLPANLTVLILSKNRIRYIRLVDTLRLLAITKLDLSSNLLQSVESNAFTSLSRLRDVELHDNPWRCDCYLMYLKKWLTNTTAVVSNEGSIRCKTPHIFSFVTVRSIDLEALQCSGYPGYNLVFQNISATSAVVTYKHEQYEPNYVKHKLVYGITTCNNCTASLFRATALELMEETYFVNIDNSPVILSSLLPGSRYRVCIYDEIYRKDVEIRSCAELMTSIEVFQVRSEQRTSIPTWSIPLSCFITLVVLTVCIILIVQKKKRRFRKSNSPTYQNCWLYASTNTLDARQEFDVAMRPRRKMMSQTSVSGNVMTSSHTNMVSFSNENRNLARRPSSYYDWRYDCRNTLRHDHRNIWYSLRKTNFSDNNSHAYNI